MRAELCLVAAGFTATLLAAAAFAQEDYSKVEVEVERLSGSVYMMEGAGGNMALSVGEEGVFLIDDEFAPLTPKIQTAIAKLSPKPVRILLNTHWHFDHTGGNQNFGKAGAVVVAQENVRKRLSNDGFIAFLGMKTRAEPPVALPIVTFTTDVKFQMNGEEIRAFHAPRAHTDGDTIVQFVKSDVIHMGDTFFNNTYPFIDTSSGGSVAGVLAAADRVLKIAGDTTRIIPGHGELATKANLKAYRDMLAAVSKRVAGQIKQGKKLEEVVASKPTAQFDAAYSRSFLSPDKFVEMLYGNLKK
ncbi:MAG TPA: MBL fold metallo-hydrolase [Burkholderiales bacterium]|nr:MBL fold metallo-hydrolase [Burkholderiales bacterium]